MQPGDPIQNVLYIDLSRKLHRVEQRPDLFADRLGGVGAAIALLAESCPKGADPLGPDNPIVLAVGPLTGLYPLASKTVAAFKSPHTGDLGESHCGGRSAMAIRMAGYGAIVITGQSSIPVYLAIHGDDVLFKDASALWGMKHMETVGRVIRENEHGSGERTIMRIGRAGERLVSYASVTTETYRHFGRLGLGAVFGSKRLKAITVSGHRSLPMPDMTAYRKLYKEIYDAVVGSPVMKKYHDLGTPQNVKPLNELGGLPTRNLQAARIEGADRISGEAFAENYLGRRLACSHCPVACIHIAALRVPYEDEQYFYKTNMISYDHELIYALGSMLGVDDPEGLLRLLDAVETWGLDAMSAGVVLAWATEAQARGLISATETGDLAFKFGDWATYDEGLRRIAAQETDFYKVLGRGVDHAAKTYGGSEYAMAFGGNEMPGYHTGPGCHLGWSVGARHSHLDNAGYSVDQKLVSEGEGLCEPEAMADQLIAEEQWRQVLASLAVCFFARGIFKKDVVARALGTAGFRYDEPALAHLGEQIYRDKYRFKLREGFTFDGLKLPRRIFETPAPTGPFDEAYLRRAIARVKAFHGAS